MRLATGVITKNSGGNQTHPEKSFHTTNPGTILFNSYWFVVGDRLLVSLVGRDWSPSTKSGRAGPDPHRMLVPVEFDWFLPLLRVNI